MLDGGVVGSHHGGVNAWLLDRRDHEIVDHLGFFREVEGFFGTFLFLFQEVSPLSLQFTLRFGSLVAFYWSLGSFVEACNLLQENDFSQGQEACNQHQASWQVFLRCS